MAGTIWTERDPGEAASHTRPQHGMGAAGEHCVLLDPNLSPDWLRIPSHTSLPADLRGKEVRVDVSLWFGLAPKPLDTGEVEWVEHRTRWHLLRLPGLKLVVVEAPWGWVCMDVSERRWALLQEAAEQSDSEARRPPRDY